MLMKLFLLLLSLFGFNSRSEAPSKTADPKNNGIDVPSPTVYHNQNAGNQRGGWDGN